MAPVTHQPDGPGFDIVLLLHVGCVVVGLATTVTSAATAARLRRTITAGAPLSAPVARYFKAGVNWAGRSVYGIPVFGFVLLALSGGAYGLRDGWVMSGLLIFVVVVLLGEGLLWPAERRLQTSLAGPIAGGTAPGAELAPTVATLLRAATACVVLLVLGSVLMVAQP
jgi:hypothetical protein